jgi:hypothetical protein
MFNSSDTVSTIKSKIIEWLEHIQRMGRERGAKRIFQDKPGGRRGVAKPRLRCLDGVKSDLRTMGVKRLKNIAMDGEEWLRIVWEASECPSWTVQPQRTVMTTA